MKKIGPFKRIGYAIFGIITWVIMLGFAYTNIGWLTAAVRTASSARERVGAVCLILYVDLPFALILFLVCGCGTVAIQQAVKGQE